MTPKERARELARSLLVSGGGDVAERLVLTSADGRDLGGWGFAPLVDRIEAAIAEAIAEDRAARE